MTFLGPHLAGKNSACDFKKPFSWSAASGSSLHGGVSFKVEKAHFAAWKRVRRTAQMNQNCPPPLCAAPWSTLWFLLSFFLLFFRGLFVALTLRVLALERMRLFCLQLEASCLQWSFLLTIDNSSFSTYCWSSFAYNFSFLTCNWSFLLTMGKCV